MVLTRMTPNRWPDLPARRLPKVASTREELHLRDSETNSVHQGGLRGLFLATRVHRAKEMAMSTQTKLILGADDRQDGRDKPSRAAEYIAALYVALLLCTPWLLRETSWLTPPSRGVEIQMSNKAQAQAADRDATAKLPATAPKVAARAN
jgi:hypothetical protein